MRVYVGHHRARAALGRFDLDDAVPSEGLVFAPATGLSDWDAVEHELTHAFRLTREASAADAPIVYLLDAQAVLGRAAPLDSAVATGLVAGARALAFEGQRDNRYATVIAAADDVTPETIAEAISFVVSSRAALGHVTMLGSEHLGALVP